MREAESPVVIWALRDRRMRDQGAAGGVRSRSRQTFQLRDADRDLETLDVL